jgi:hypothetical protein
LWGLWREFWDDFVPEVCKGEPFGVCVNGDALDGRHHGSTTQISQNLSDQSRIALAILGPIVARCEARYYHIRGTEAHVGPSGEAEESLARELGAIPNAIGQYARFSLRIRIGWSLGSILHHIGTTGSAAYEQTALAKEMAEEMQEAAKWGWEPPDWLIRSHRHRYSQIEIPSKSGHALIACTPAWQAKTPYSYRLAGVRVSQPQFGGVVVRVADDGVLFIRPKVWSPEPPPIEGEQPCQRKFRVSRKS